MLRTSSEILSEWESADSISILFNYLKCITTNYLVTGVLSQTSSYLWLSVTMPLLNRCCVHLDFIHRLRRWLKFYFTMVFHHQEGPRMSSVLTGTQVPIWDCTYLNWLSTWNVSLAFWSLFLGYSYLELVFIVTHFFACNLQLNFAYVLKIIIA